MCREDTGFHVSLHDLTFKDVSKKARKKDDGMYVVSYESKSLRMSIANINTNEISANNGQSQIRLAYNDFLYDANKGDFLC